MKANLVQLLIGAGLLVGVPALANGVRYDFIGSSAGDWQLFGPPESSRPILDTTAPGSVLDDPTTTFWNRAVNPGMTVRFQKVVVGLSRILPGAVVSMMGLELSAGPNKSQSAALDPMKS
jgi:hypothetical protein